MVIIAEDVYAQHVVELAIDYANQFKILKYCDYIDSYYYNRKKIDKKYRTYFPIGGYYYRITVICEEDYKLISVVKECLKKFYNIHSIKIKLDKSLKPKLEKIFGFDTYDNKVIKLATLYNRLIKNLKFYEYVDAYYTKNNSYEEIFTSFFPINNYILFVTVGCDDEYQFMIKVKEYLEFYHNIVPINIILDKELDKKIKLYNKIVKFK